MQPDMPEGVTVKCEKRLMMFSADAQSWPYLLINWAGSVALSVLANAIYDSIKKRSKKDPETITINETKVRFERGEVTEFIQTQITSGKEAPAKRKPRQQ